MISERQLIANRKNIEIANFLGLNKRFGKNNPRWNNGSKLKKNYPCPICGRDRITEGRYANRLCIKCYRNRPSNFNRKKYSEKWSFELYNQHKEIAFKLLGSKCAFCRVGNLPLCCYHFHHKDKKKKKYNIGTLFRSKNMERLNIELKKCILLCANCHAIVHWTEEMKETND